MNGFSGAHFSNLRQISGGVISSPETLHIYEWAEAPTSLHILKSKLVVS